MHVNKPQSISFISTKISNLFLHLYFINNWTYKKVLLSSWIWPTRAVYSVQSYIHYMHFKQFALAMQYLSPAICCLSYLSQKLNFFEVVSSFSLQVSFDKQEENTTTTLFPADVCQTSHNLYFHVLESLPKMDSWDFLLISLFTTDSTAT